MKSPIKAAVEAAMIGFAERRKRSEERRQVQLKKMSEYREREKLNPDGLPKRRRTRLLTMHAVALIGIALSVASGARAANAPILQAVTPTQVGFRYHRADTTVCVWEVSTSATYSPLIADLVSQNDTGTASTRFFVLGQNTGLTPGTLHYWRQTCGSEVYAGQFTTRATPTGTPSNTLRISTGGHPLANKITLEYGTTPALGSSVTGDCTPGCSVAATVNSGLVMFTKHTYLNESDVVASGSVQVGSVP